MKKLFSDVVKEHKAETVLFFVGVLAWVIDAFIDIFSAIDYYWDIGFAIDYYWDIGFNVGTYIFPLIILFGLLMFKLNESKYFTQFLAAFFVCFSLVMFFWFLDYIVIGYRVFDIIGILVKILFSVVAIVLLVTKFKNGHIVLLASTFVCTVYLCVVDFIYAIDYEEIELLLSTVLTICFYLLSSLIIYKQLDYKNIFVHQPSQIESELQLLKDKKFYGLITEEEYNQKRAEILNKLF